MNRDFRSDNVSPPSPEILKAAFEACNQWLDAYGDDEITFRVGETLASVFEHQVVAFPILTGTAANALALAQVSGRFGRILCHETSHIYLDECGAVEFHTQGNRLQALHGENGKLDVAACIKNIGISDDVHQLLPAALSMSQATEVGTFYSAEELTQLSAWAKQNGLAVQMDGTRFANAIVASGSTAADLSWRSGVDVLCLGATKGGAIGAEVVLFFDRHLATDFKRLMKRSGHLASRLWFLAAQLEAYFREDRWLETARHANTMAIRLRDGLANAGSISPCFPVQTNMVFLEMTTDMLAPLDQRGFQFYRTGNGDVSRTARFVTSHATMPGDIDRLVDAIVTISRGLGGAPARA